MDINAEMISGIITALLLVLSSVFGLKYKKYKNILIKILDAIKDGKVTEKEVAGILEEFKLEKK